EVGRDARCGAWREGVSEAGRALGRLEPAELREAGEGLGHAGDAAAGEHAPAEVADLDRLAPGGLVRGEVDGGYQPAAFLRERDQHLADRARVGARVALRGEELERRRGTRL